MDRDAARCRRVDRRERGARARGRVWPRGLGVSQIAIRGGAGAVRRAARDASLTRLSAARSLVRRDRPRTLVLRRETPRWRSREPTSSSCRRSTALSWIAIGPGPSRIAAPDLAPIEAELPIATKIATIARPTWNRPVSCCYARCPTRFRSPMRAVSGPCRRPISPVPAARRDPGKRSAGHSVGSGSRKAGGLARRAAGRGD